MEKIIDNTYISKNHNKNKLKEIGFYYDKDLSNIDSQYYSFKFPVYKYNGKPLLDCIISIDSENGYTIVNVYKSNTKTIYPPFYQKVYGDYDSVLRMINNKIIEKLKELGIKKV